jgi:hypothetical protein
VDEQVLEFLLVSLLAFQQARPERLVEPEGATSLLDQSAPPPERLREPRTVAERLAGTCAPVRNWPRANQSRDAPHPGLEGPARSARCASRAPRGKRAQPLDAGRIRQARPGGDAGNRRSRAPGRSALNARSGGASGESTLLGRSATKRAPRDKGKPQTRPSWAKGKRRKKG